MKGRFEAVICGKKILVDQLIDTMVELAIEGEELFSDMLTAYAGLPGDYDLLSPDQTTSIVFESEEAVDVGQLGSLMNIMAAAVPELDMAYREDSEEGYYDGWLNHHSGPGMAYFDDDDPVLPKWTKTVKVDRGDALRKERWGRRIRGSWAYMNDRLDPYLRLALFFEGNAPCNPPKDIPRFLYIVLQAHQESSGELRELAVSRRIEALLDIDGEKIIEDYAMDRGSDLAAYCVCRLAEREDPEFQDETRGLLAKLCASAQGLLVYGCFGKNGEHGFSESFCSAPGDQAVRIAEETARLKCGGRELPVPGEFTYILRNRTKAAEHVQRGEELLARRDFSGAAENFLAAVETGVYAPDACIGMFLACQRAVSVEEWERQWEERLRAYRDSSLDLLSVDVDARLFELMEQAGRMGLSVEEPPRLAEFPEAAFRRKIPDSFFSSCDSCRVPYPSCKKALERARAELPDYLFMIRGEDARYGPILERIQGHWDWARAREADLAAREELEKRVREAIDRKAAGLQEMIDSALARLTEQTGIDHKQKECCVRVRFTDGKEFTYSCPFAVKIGDSVIVEGARGKAPGEVVKRLPASVENGYLKKVLSIVGSA